MAYADRHTASPWRLASKPFREVLVFSGRSTRTEALIFVLIFSTVAGVPTAIAGDLKNPVWAAAGIAVAALLYLPMIALLVRRLHDFGRSGWWALIVAAQIALAAQLATAPQGNGGFSFVFLNQRIRPEWNAFTTPLLLAYIALVLVEIAIYFWPPTEGPNRYGPDPRLDPEPAPAA